MDAQEAEKIQVLLVEDSPTDALVVQDELAHAKGARFSVVHIGQLNEALAHLQAQSFDVVLLDLSLPDSHGFETFVRLHAASEVPVVVLSGRADEELAVKAVHAGAQDYLVKGHMGEDVLPRSIRYAIERQRAERILAESEERYRLLIEGSPDAYLVICEGKIVFANAASLKLFGADRMEQLLGRPILAIISPEYHDILHKRIQNAHANGTNPLIELLGVRLDGTIVAVESTSSPFIHEGGPAVRVVMHDITGRKIAERMIVEQAALLDHARDAIFVHDIEGCLSYWNKSAQRVFGWTAEEANGRNVQSLFYRDPELFHTTLEAALRKGDWMGEASMLTKAGSEVLVEGRWTLLRDADGNPKSILVIDTDITEVKKIEAQLFRAQRIENIGTLAGGIAHDLNNVLGPMIMAVDLLRETVTAPREVELLDIMEKSGTRGADMVKQVLFFARGVEGERTLISPVRLVKEIEAIIRDTFPKGIRVVTDAPEGSWKTSGDQTQIHQVLLNLCINARDAMPGGGRLSLTVRNRQIDEQFVAMNPAAHPGSYVILEVADTGQGILPEVMRKMFEPFYSTKAVGKGTGLGLSTTQAIVKGHGGYITVESEPGKGTTFQVSLPAETGSGLPQLEAVKGALPHGEGELVLIIEDEASIRSITGQTLEAFGYRVMTANDGAEGVAQYAQHASEIAVVITDMAMPVMEGVPTVRVLLRVNPDVKIIAASGSTAKGLEAECLVEGVKHFMPKPYTAEAMLRALHKLLHSAA